MDSVDIERPGGLVRQLIFGTERAVLDVSSEAITANWTTAVGPVRFLTLLEDTPIAESDPTGVVGMTDGFEETDYTSARRLAEVGGDYFLTACDFIRFDVSMTQSVAWQRLRTDVLLVGFGDHTQGIAEEGISTLLRDLLRLTTEGWKESPIGVLERELEALGRNFAAGQ